ncbi:MAG TPA: ABC transporter substrate-binding protein [Candidatus Sulfotelmatobacter sp.]|nr:ABC transporter substrate-binding protein [Candidatus Sulfotelmatobacter sp.]
MKHIAWQWLAISSVLIAALAASAETRPQYGGTLHVSMLDAPLSLDPADRATPDSFGRRSLTELIFETLVSVDKSGRATPVLADSWQTRGGRRWQFRIRHNVWFHDGSPLTAESVAASLRFANPAWNVTADRDSVIVESDLAEQNLLADLALSRNAIAKRDSDKLSGTGPFHIVDWQPGKELALGAEENCWRGRPFLDGIEIEMGRGFHDQMTALQLGKADLIEVAPEQTRRVSQQGQVLVSSAPMELLALVFGQDGSSPDEKSLREALGWSVERGSMRDVLLQGTGQATGSILPGWMSGYGFVFPTTADLARARSLRDQTHVSANWKLGYDGSDPMNRLLAERISLNARDAGLSLQPTSGGNADLRLMRIPLASTDPWSALQIALAEIGLPPMESKGHSIEDLYAAETAVLATGRVIPLFHLPVSYASVSNLKNWSLRPDGSWNLGDAWLESARP